MAGYDVYIGDMLLPIAPDKITTKINGRNKVYSLINEGELNILKLPGLSTVNFSILLPLVLYPFATYRDGYRQPSYYLNELERLKLSKQPFQFIISRHDTVTARKNSHNTNMTVSIEDYQINEDAKSNGFDIKVDITLKQYKEFKTKTFEVTLPSPTAPIALTPVRPVSTVTVTTESGGDWEDSGGSGGGGGVKKKKYKVQIPGMGVVEKWATSMQDAITQAMGTNWTGTVYVDGETKYVNKGKLALAPEAVKKAAATAVNTVNVTAAVNTVQKAIQTVSNTVNTVKNTLTAAVSNILNKNILSTNKSGSTTTATVVKPAQTSSGKAITSVITKVATKNILTKK